MCELFDMLDVSVLSKGFSLIPQLSINSNPEVCISCLKCNRVGSKNVLKLSLSKRRVK